MDSEYILAPQIVTVRFEVAPALNALESLRELTELQRLSGLGEWVTQTAAALPQERLDLNLMIFESFPTLFFDVMPAADNYRDLADYIDAVAARDPVDLRDAVVEAAAHTVNHYPAMLEQLPAGVTAERLLDEPELFHRFVTAACESSLHPDTFWERAYALYRDPPQMQATIVEHLRWMWDEALAEEWARVEPMIRESVAAFQTMDFSNLTLNEATRAVTTRDLSAMNEDKYGEVETVIFVPSAHIGPYVLRAKIKTMLYTVFGARLPRGVPDQSSALTRAELLTRLNALGDDTRLRILELLTRSDELCAQEIIERLGLSQSSVSRHLSQLSANGFIIERRKEVAKCYSLNTDRVVDTLRTLTNFLSRQ